MLIYLNSDDRKSLNVFPSNVLSDFSILMPTPFELEGKWEMALVEVQFPFSWVEEKHTDIFLKYEVEMLFNDGSLNTQNHFLNIQTIKDKSIDEIISELNMENIKMRFTRTDDGYIEINISTDDFLVGAGSWSRSCLKRIDFSPNLADILGFEQKTHKVLNIQNYITRSTQHPFLPHVLSTIAIHCNLIEPQIVSSTYQKVLRAVPTKDKKELKSQTVNYQTPRYVPMQETSFSSIQIQLLDLDGNRIKFESGSVILCIDIRPMEREHIKF